MAEPAHPLRYDLPPAFVTDTDQSLAQRLLAGDKRALARAISLVENDDPGGMGARPGGLPEDRERRGDRLHRALRASASRPCSAALTKLERERERTVAVLSIDPSSPFTKGALLGDRIRLSDHFLDPGVFIRSMANRGALGGLSEATLQAALLMDASGRDVVLLETVGVGQAEVDIIDHADTVVLVLMPGSGDSIQALKAGMMEIPDVIVVNKADHPLTDTMVREIKGVLALGPREGWQVPIVRTEAVRGEGVAGARREARRAPRVHRGRGDAVGAPAAQPDERGARDRHLPHAPGARGLGPRGSRRPGAARPRRRPRARSGERRDADPRGTSQPVTACPLH